MARLQRAATASEVTPQLLGFFLGRSLVSASFSLANQAMPDMTPALGADFKRWVALMDAANALLGFMMRPIWGAAVDAWGRKPALVAGCAGAGVARWVYASDATSVPRYVAYRVLNFAANVPVMMSSTALLADACGGRSSELYAVVNRRMWMWLAVVRMLVVWAAGRAAAAAAAAPADADAAPPSSETEPEHPPKPPHQEDQQRRHHRRVATWQLAAAGAASATGAAVFAALVTETLGARRGFGSPLAVWRDSLSYFSRSRERRALVPVVLLSALPVYAMTTSVAHCRETFGWGPKERARLTLVENASEVLMPLLVSELSAASPRSFRLALRVSALCSLNSALTPAGWTLLLNPVLGRLVEGGPEYNRALVAAQRSFSSPLEGEGALEAALANLEFPLGFLLPGAFLNLSAAFRTPRVVFFAVALGVLAASEWAWPRAARELVLAVDAGDLRVVVSAWLADLARTFRVVGPLGQ